MKKKIFVLFIVIISLPLLLLVINGNATPDQVLDHDICHTVPGGYTISADINGTTVNPSDDIYFNVTGSAVIIFNVTATGNSLFVQAPNENTTIMQNGQLNILPTTDRILDDSGEDKNSSLNAIIITFNITIPETEGYYSLFILAGDNSSGVGNPPDFQYIEIGFSVGGAAPEPEDEFEIFNHFGLLLGMSALILLSVGTILVLINENKFVKIHGIFSGASWILTLINAISLITQFNLDNIDIWFSFEPFGVHVSHIILGATGLFTGLLSMLFGIAAERKYAKLTGYITLICWWSGYFLALIIVPPALDDLIINILPIIMSLIIPVSIGVLLWYIETKLRNYKRKRK
ncbi:MAG: hypothetical protein E3J90_10240 [Promethearchaeota archaeon]|nr:MAG: hypothetical protein E3J90_10240 [Candidatus Lokiarchaeota archaeon]